jgi:hypothetical protein
VKCWNARYAASAKDSAAPPWVPLYMEVGIRMNEGEVITGTNWKLTAVALVLSYRFQNWENVHTSDSLAGKAQRWQGALSTVEAPVHLQ